MSSAARKTRADAGRNRARVLEVAGELFAEHGDEVQMAEVARTAGVGVGTVYRHFPTRGALIEAVAEQRFVAILAFARERCLPEPDARRALRCFLGHVGEVHERGRALSGAIEAALGHTAPLGAVRTELEELGGALLERGKADGVIRPDATVGDLYMIVGALAAVSRQDIGDWRRFVEITLDGLEPSPDRNGPVAGTS